MHLTAARIRARLADERGFTMIAMLGVLAAAMAFSIAAFTAARGDINLSRHDQDQKRAYAAAEAGVQDYFFHLTQDNAYWAKCATPTPTHPALNQKGASPLKTRTVPGSTASYAIELLPANGNTACSTTNAEGTMIVGTGQMSGTFSIRSTGISNGVKRKIIATFRRRSFLDYLWFTNLETSDPAWYVLKSNGYPTRSGDSDSNGNNFVANPNGIDLLTWASTNCPRYWRNGRGNLSYPPAPDDSWQKQINNTWGSTSRSKVSCSEIQFVSGDTINGPMHTNDDLLACGSPVWGRSGGTDDIEVSGSGWRPCSSGGTPTINGDWKPNSPVLTPPPSDTSLKQVVNSTYLFQGKTTIVLNGTSMTVTNSKLSGGSKTLALPANGLIYVDYDTSPGAVCNLTSYNALDPYANDAACGNVYVSGTYSKDLTIAAAKDVIVAEDIRRSSGADVMFGLIANNFVRVYHPVNRSSSDPTECTNSSSTPKDIIIDAAILALNHSFTVDNYYCGDDLGKLTVNGTIAQEHRGPVGQGNGYAVDSGYLKNYVYDDRLKLREPPHFLDPVQASWRIQRYAEQVG